MTDIINDSKKINVMLKELTTKINSVKTLSDTTKRKYDGMIEWFFNHSKTEEDFVQFMKNCNWTEEEARNKWRWWN